MYAYNVQVLRTKKLHPFSTTITRLTTGSTGTARLLAPKVSNMDSQVAERLCLIYKAALLWKMADASARKAQKRYQKDYDIHVRFEHRFTVCRNVIVERLPPMVSAVDRMVCEG